jgi:hypothetical protein
MQPTEAQLKNKIKRWLIFLMTGLVLSGITAFPIESELAVAMNNLPAFTPKMQLWLTTIYTAVNTTNAQYPYLSYGTDWLAFAHIIFPLAFIAGSVRHIPLFWQLIDCSFGVIGIIPLYIAYRYTQKLESSNRLTAFIPINR